MYLPSRPFLCRRITCEDACSWHLTDDSSWQQPWGPRPGHPPGPAQWAGCRWWLDWGLAVGGLRGIRRGHSQGLMLTIGSPSWPGALLHGERPSSSEGSAQKAMLSSAGPRAQGVGARQVGALGDRASPGSGDGTWKAFKMQARVPGNQPFRGCWGLSARPVSGAVCRRGWCVGSEVVQVRWARPVPFLALSLALGCRQALYTLYSSRGQVSCRNGLVSAGRLGRPGLRLAGRRPRSRQDPPGASTWVQSLLPAHGQFPGCDWASGRACPFLPLV